MPDAIEDLRDAMVELDRLRRRELHRRRESEAVLQIVQVLTDQSDDAHLPSVMMEVLAAVFSSADVAIILPTDNSSASTLPPLQSWPADSDFHAWSTLGRLKTYMEKQPRIIISADMVPDLKGKIPQQGSLLLGGLKITGQSALLVVHAGDQRKPFSPQELNLFKRIIPLVEQTLLRQQELSVRNRLELELRNAQKMESLGTLAGGIAHEINTPLQYIADNLTFLKGATTDLLTFADSMKAFADQQGNPDLTDHLSDAWDQAEMDFLKEDLPDAIEQTLDGVGRIAKIVRAIKEFSHPGANIAGNIDINHEIETALTVTRNQWKYISDVTLNLTADLPNAPGAPDNIRQVLLNLIVNAAHAIEDRINTGDTNRGTITISSAIEADNLLISIADNGVGMPDHVKEKAFDMFFTTKEPGRGTGQGLPICHAIVVQKHGGRMEILSEPGQGTEFVIHLPLTHHSTGENQPD